MRNKLFLACILLLAALLGGSAYTMQQDVKQARTIYVKLRPADPRALLMGDYMTLRYEFEKTPWELEQACDGASCPVSDATLYLAENGEAFNYPPGEKLVIKARGPNYRIPHQYYFEEGTGARYQEAQYGVLALTKSGKLVLKSLADKNLQIIK